MHKQWKINDNMYYSMVNVIDELQVKAANSHKGPYDFDLLVPIQELGGEHLVSLLCDTRAGRRTFGKFVV